MRSASRPSVKDAIFAVAEPFTRGPRKHDGWQGGKAIRQAIESAFANVRVISETDVTQLNDTTLEYTCVIDWTDRFHTDKPLNVRVWIHDAVQYYDLTVQVY